VDPDAERYTPWAAEVDHYPQPLHRLKELYPDPEDYRRRANDPDGCRLVHRKCHADRDVIPSAVHAVTRSAEWDNLDGVNTGAAHAYDLAEVVTRLEARDKGDPRYRTTTAQPVHAGIGIG